MLARLPLGVTLPAIAAMLVYGPIAQPANYHAFADVRVLAGIPHAGDVISNVGFALVAIWGLRALKRPGAFGSDDRATPGYVLFLFSLLLTSLASTFYHWAPDNGRLVWDRLPIALACAGLLSAVRAETDSRANPRLWAGLLTVAAIASVFWWHVTEQAGSGDLRPYLLLQGLPLVLIPLWQAEAGAARGDRIAFGVAIGLYVVAKLAELADREIHGVLGFVSGHTIKHLLATAGAGVLVAQLGRRQLRAANQSRYPAASLHS
jgi:hypothetical protein